MCSPDLLSGTNEIEQLSLHPQGWRLNHTEVLAHFPQFVVMEMQQSALPSLHLPLAVAGLATSHAQEKYKSLILMKNKPKLSSYKGKRWAELYGNSRAELQKSLAPFPAKQQETKPPTTSVWLLQHCVLRSGARVGPVLTAGNNRRCSHKVLPYVNNNRVALHLL